MKPLDGLLVLELSQYLAGPLTGLRLADLGARVIKIERPRTGDAGRHLAIRNSWADDGSSRLFHTINRNKESYCADLKTPVGRACVHQLIQQTDVLIHNFLPGVMERLELGYAESQALNPQLIYAEISGYGSDGPWSGKPGQDLLVQALSGLMYTTGSHTEPPTPFGLAIADYITANHAVQGILAAIYRRRQTGQGGKVAVSLLESTLDLQFELLTTYYQTQQLPRRAAVHNAHPLLGAPYGLYATADGFLAVAMNPLPKLMALIDYPDINNWENADLFDQRDDIKQALSAHFRRQSTAYWLDRLVAADQWVMPVLDWPTLRQTDTYKTLSMEQTLSNGLLTTRCPIRINGERLTSKRPAPSLGTHTASINEQLAIDPNGAARTAHLTPTRSTNL